MSEHRPHPVSKPSSPEKESIDRSAKERWWDWLSDFSLLLYVMVGYAALYFSVVYFRGSRMGQRVFYLPHLLYERISLVRFSTVPDALGLAVGAWIIAFVIAVVTSRRKRAGFFVLVVATLMMIAALVGEVFSAISWSYHVDSMSVDGHRYHLHVTGSYDFQSYHHLYRCEPLGIFCKQVYEGTAGHETWALEPGSNPGTISVFSGDGDVVYTYAP